MSTKDRKEWLLGQVHLLSEAMRDGKFSEIDLSEIEKEAAELASNFGEIINNIEEVGYKVGGDTQDVQEISQHLEHISKTTQEGVMKVIDYSETIISDANEISDRIVSINKKTEGKVDLSEDMDAMNLKLGDLQNNAFTIMTSLEFEDINRQKLEKILKKLSQVYDNLLKVLFLLKIKEKIENNDSGFINDIKKISDPNDQTENKQDLIDALLSEFGL